MKKFLYYREVFLASFLGLLSFYILILLHGIFTAYFFMPVFGAIVHWFPSTYFVFLEGTIVGIITGAILALPLGMLIRKHHFIFWLLYIFFFLNALAIVTLIVSEFEFLKVLPLLLSDDLYLFLQYIILSACFIFLGKKIKQAKVHSIEPLFSK